MIAGWMAYSVLVSVLFGSAAFAAEYTLRLYRRSLRWAWLVAIVGCLAAPSAAYWSPLWRASTAGPLQPLFDAAIEIASVGAPSDRVSSEPPGGIARLDRALLAGWLLSSLALLGFLARSHHRLKRRSRSWPTQAVEGRSVLVSRTLGPAVMGFFRGRIVVPTWALEMEDGFRRMILLHELEHLRAGDQRLLYGGLAALVVAPWNLPLWWLFRRLRLAIELDCDRRLLEKGADPRAYGELLFAVGRRASRSRLVPAAFSERQSLLELRVRNMVRKAPKLRGVKAAVATLLAATLLAFACTAPRPSTPAPATGPAVEPEPLEQAPVFTPYTEAPRLRSPEQAVASVAGHYPEALKRAGVGGTVVVWLFVDERGAVRNTKVQKTSARPELDDAAQAAASEFEFIPARNRGRPVSVWVAIPITFEPPAQDPNEADRRALRATLRMIATVQESRWREAGRYYQDVAAEAVQDVIEEGVEIVLFEVRDSAWAAVARRGESECAMFYGDIPPPRPYARHGRAVCK